MGDFGKQIPQTTPCPAQNIIKITEFIGSNQLGKKILGSNQMNSIEITCFESLKFYYSYYGLV